MGAWGYGIYDSDAALDAVSDIFSEINVKSGHNLLLDDGTVLHHEWSGVDRDGKLNVAIIQLLLDNYKKIEKNVLKDEYLDYQGEKYLVFADIITSNGREIPNAMLKRSISAINSLIEPGGHADEYDTPLNRKQVITKVLVPLQEQLLQQELPKKTDNPSKKMKL